VLENIRDKAYQLLRSFKGEHYAFGINVLNKTGEYAGKFGEKTLLISNNSKWLQGFNQQIINSLQDNGVSLVGGGIIPGARPNAPREDVYRIETYILHYQPDCLVAVGSGSVIDAVKAANVLANLGGYSPDIETYFGTNQVTEVLLKTGKSLLPLIAVQTAASSGAHLTKYSNITDPELGQKKLIVDEAIVPQCAVFDYSVTRSMPQAVTLDGAFDGIAHCLEVFYGATKENYAQIETVALTGIELIITGLLKLTADDKSMEARELIGLGTDLGGYSIMLGGTSGPHLTSFSLVDVTSHGRACAIMNPYYTVFFAPAIQRQLKSVGPILQRNGFIDADFGQLTGVDLAVTVAKGMLELSRKVGFPTKLSDLPKFTDQHITKALTAAKNPQLEMKLKNMPVALDATSVDEYMEPILQAAKIGDFSLIKQMN
jgi:alcohol dehydrogenase